MFENIKRALAALKGEPQPQTYVTTGGSQHNYFSERTRNAENLKKFQTIYEQGGMVAEAIDSYALFALSNGWRLEGEDENLNQTVQDFLDTFDFDMVMWQAIVDALVFGDAFQENVANRGGDLFSVVPRLASSFSINYDQFGQISGYEQHLLVDGIEKVAYLKPEQITHLQLFKLGGSVYGHSLIQRAYDEIIRDTKTAESSAVAVERHGFKKYHIRVGKTGETIPQLIIQGISREFEQLETKNDFVTPYDVEIRNIDEGGLAGIEAYNDISVMRMAAAIGVPEEILGLRRGSTDATANTRVQTFYDKIGTIQKKLERCYNLNVIDRITGVPGAVQLKFNDINPEDEKQKAVWISQIMGATAIDPFAVLPKAWIQEQFGITETDLIEDTSAQDTTSTSQNPTTNDNQTQPGYPEKPNSDEVATK